MDSIILSQRGRSVANVTIGLSPNGFTSYQIFMPPLRDFCALADNTSYILYLWKKRRRAVRINVFLARFRRYTRADRRFIIYFSSRDRKAIYSPFAHLWLFLAHVSLFGFLPPLKTSTDSRSGKQHIHRASHVSLSMLYKNVPSRCWLTSIASNREEIHLTKKISVYFLIKSSV